MCEQNKYKEYYIKWTVEMIRNNIIIITIKS